MLNVVIFGVGKAYQKKESFFDMVKEKMKIVALVDNSTIMQGKVIDGLEVMAPNMLYKIKFDCILITSRLYEKDILTQLDDMKLIDKVYSFDKLRGITLRGVRKEYLACNHSNEHKRGKILLVNTDMSFSGGILVSIYAAIALKQNGYTVMLAAPSIDSKLLEETLALGLDVTIDYSLPYVFDEDLEWVKTYDFVLVNVFQMMNCAYEFSKLKPTLWWIHEDRSIWKSFYQDTKKNFKDIDTSEWMDRLKIAGVSEIAQEAFNYFYPNTVKDILPFGIPDAYKEYSNIRQAGDKIILAVTAGFSEFKGQRILVNALEALSEAERNMIEVWFIGPDGKNKEDLKEICGNIPNAKFWGLLSHNEVINTIVDADVLVCPSLIETMSMSTVEGMMLKKICITTDMTGVANYINDGVNGFITRAGDAENLAETIRYIINNIDGLTQLKENARNTYLNEFSMGVFGKRLLSMVDESIGEQ